eukprot:NODE_148_length_17471_cov_0.413136.p16 type:complete len:103 gc:universal NODE_148_length_17471_cov_0.413136:13377-13069(-)
MLLSFILTSTNITSRIKTIKIIVKVHAVQVPRFLLFLVIDFSNFVEFTFVIRLRGKCYQALNPLSQLKNVSHLNKMYLDEAVKLQILKCYYDLFFHVFLHLF